MTKKRKYRPDIKSSTDPIFTSTCHPYTTANWKEIIEDAMPDHRVIAVVGRCEACNGIQPRFRSAENIDRKKLIRVLHGNYKWLFETEEVVSLRADPDKPHGELKGAVAPKPGRPAAAQPTEPPAPEPEPAPDESDSNVIGGTQP